MRRREPVRRLPGAEVNQIDQSLRRLERLWSGQSHALHEVRVSTFAWLDLQVEY